MTCWWVLIWPSLIRTFCFFLVFYALRFQYVKSVNDCHHLSWNTFLSKQKGHRVPRKSTEKINIWLYRFNACKLHPFKIFRSNLLSSKLNLFSKMVEPLYYDDVLPPSMCKTCQANRTSKNRKYGSRKYHFPFVIKTFQTLLDFSVQNCSSRFLFYVCLRFIPALQIVRVLKRPLKRKQLPPLEFLRGLKK